MPRILSRIGALWSYITPRRTQERRNRPFRAPRASPIPRAVAQRRTARRARVSSARASDAEGSDVSQDWSVGSDSPIRAAADLSDHGSDPVDDNQETELQTANATTDWRSGETEVNDSTLVVDQAQYEIENVRVTYAEGAEGHCQREAAKLRRYGRSEEEVQLFCKLCMRGHEPLMPGKWWMDFDTIPMELFAEDDSQAFIKSASDRDFRAIRALYDLVQLGPRVRDAMSMKKSAEEAIRRGIVAYTKWACADANFNRSVIPVFDIVSGPLSVSTDVLERRMLDKLGDLAARYRAAYRTKASVAVKEETGSEDGQAVEQVPAAGEDDSQPELTLYGIVISGTLLAFVGYDPYVAEPSLRTIAMFNFGKADFDVWNSLAIAIFAVHCRNMMAELSEFAEEGGVEEKGSVDPDA